MDRAPVATGAACTRLVDTCGRGSWCGRRATRTVRGRTPAQPCALGARIRGVVRPAGGSRPCGPATRLGTRGAAALLYDAHQRQPGAARVRDQLARGRRAGRHRDPRSRPGASRHQRRPRARGGVHLDGHPTAFSRTRTCARGAFDMAEDGGSRQPADPARDRVSTHRSLVRLPLNSSSSCRIGRRHRAAPVSGSWTCAVCCKSERRSRASIYSTRFVLSAEQPGAAFVSRRSALQIGTVAFWRFRASVRGGVRPHVPRHAPGAGRLLPARHLWRSLQPTKSSSDPAAACPQTATCG